MVDKIKNKLILSLFITFLVFIGEILGGILSNSLALFSDAGHVLTDGFALVLSLLALLIMHKPADFRATYGYQRLGLLAAIINGSILIVIAIFIFYESYKRFIKPPEIESNTMLIIAILGLAGNLLIAFILGHKHKDLNVRSAWLHILGDIISSLGVITAGLIIKFAGWRNADPIVSCFISIIIIISGSKVIKEALWIFLELSPTHLNVTDVSKKLLEVSGVKDVHDVHIWSIGYGIPAFSAHIRVDDQKLSSADCIRKEIDLRLGDMGIKHSVIQIECECNNDNFYCRILGDIVSQRQ